MRISVDDEVPPAPPSIITPWLLPPPRTYILTHAHVVDVVAGRVLRDQTVTLRDGLIASIEPSSSAAPPSASSTTIDLSHRFLCPGLIDCHVHLTHVPGAATLAASNATPPAVALLRQPFHARQMLHRGFTSARDCGGAGRPLQQAIADGAVSGPRLFVCGRAISQTGGHGDARSPWDEEQRVGCCGGGATGLAELADGVDECLKAARERVRSGADFIKIMTSGGVASPTDKLKSVQYTPEEIQAFTTVARNADTYVTAHAYTPAAITQAITNGVTGIEHGNLLDAPTAALMARHHVFLTPTLITYATMASPRFRAYLPPALAAKNAEVLAAGLQSLRLAHAAGVTMCYGSDLLGPLAVAQNEELALRAQVLDPPTVLQAATVNAARMLRQGARLGQVRAGFVADLLVLAANPLDDVGVLVGEIDWAEGGGGWRNEQLLAVVKDGRVFASRLAEMPKDVREDL